MKADFKKSIILLMFCAALSGYSSITEIERISPEVKRKAGALIKTAHEVNFLSKTSFRDVNVKECEGARQVIHQTFNRMKNLWSSTTIFSIERDGGIQALNNRLKRFENQDLLKEQVANLHISVIKSFLSSLVELKDVNPTGWSWILHNESYYRTLTIFRFHLRNLERYQGYFISNQIRAVQNNITVLNGELRTENARRAAIDFANRQDATNNALFF